MFVPTARAVHALGTLIMSECLRPDLCVQLTSARTETAGGWAEGRDEGPKKAGTGFSCTAFFGSRRAFTSCNCMREVLSKHTSPHHASCNLRRGLLGMRSSGQQQLMGMDNRELSMPPLCSPLRSCSCAADLSLLDQEQDQALHQEGGSSSLPLPFRISLNHSSFALHRRLLAVVRDSSLAGGIPRPREKAKGGSAHQEFREGVENVELEMAAVGV
eukprot:1590917-Rhodomonas_salina.1